MEDFVLIDPKLRRLIKAKHDENNFQSMTNAETTIKTRTKTMTNNSKAPIEIRAERASKNISNFDTAKRSLSEYSIETYKKSDFVGRRSNSCQSMRSNESIINPNSCKKQSYQISRKFLMDICKMPQTACCRKHWLSDLVDILLRLFAVIIFIKLETANAFKRKIHMEELWLYQNPTMPDIISPTELLLAVILVPYLTSIICYGFTRNARDYRAANWTWTLALCVNGLLTSMLKISFGRPRPDFFYRCFPDGVMVLNNITDPKGIHDIFNCTGNQRDINEGRKSFPSGHASFAFTSCSFVTFYIGAKLHAFDARGRGQTWRLVLSTLPLVVATLVAISRTCDYHHHWQDVFVGALLGLFSSYLSYRQYFPSIFDDNSDIPLPRFSGRNCTARKYSENEQIEKRNGEAQPLLCDTKIDS